VRTLFIGGNGWPTRRSTMRDPKTGALFTGTATVLIGATKGATDGIVIGGGPGKLIATGVAITAGELEYIWQGEDLDGALLAAAQAAETAGTRYEVYERVIVVGAKDYADVEPLAVRTVRLAGQP
jgi:hypothetical protein